MKICPITYQDIKWSQNYSDRGLKAISGKLTNLKVFPYTAIEQRRKSEELSSKMSIQGIQPKLSAKINVKEKTFEIVSKGGRYILKPQTANYKFLPENEDLTMRLAAAAGMEVPLHGLIYSKDKTFTYFIRRFDRKGQTQKIHIEDFAQLSGESRDTKYESSMEKVAEIVSKFCTFPVIQKLELFKRTVFSFLVGNEDMHLKNFSVIVRDDVVQLSPAYDFVNSTIVVANPKEEMALPVNGKKNKLTYNDIVKYYAMDRLEIAPKASQEILDGFKSCMSEWSDLVSKCFLPEKEKERYKSIIEDRARRLRIV